MTRQPRRPHTAISSQWGIGFVNEVAELPDGGIDVSEGHGGVYAAPCPCIRRGPLRPSPPNAWVMACLWPVIRQTHMDALTVKNDQNQTNTHGHTHAHTHTERVATLTQLQSLFTGGARWVGVGGQKQGVSCGPSVRGNYVCDKFHKPSIPERPGWAKLFICDLGPIYF